MRYDRVYITALKVTFWLFILTYGEPSILDAIIELIGRLP